MCIWVLFKSTQGFNVRLSPIDKNYPFKILTSTAI